MNDQSLLEQDDNSNYRQILKTKNERIRSIVQQLFAAGFTFIGHAISYSGGLEFPYSTLFLIVLSAVGILLGEHVYLIRLNRYLTRDYSQVKDLRRQIKFLNELIDTEFRRFDRKRASQTTKEEAKKAMHYYYTRIRQCENLIDNIIKKNR